MALPNVHLFNNLFIIIYHAILQKLLFFNLRIWLIAWRCVHNYGQLIHSLFLQMLLHLPFPLKIDLELLKVNSI